MGFLFGLVRSVVLKLLWPALLIGAGWYGGAKLGAPEFLTKAADFVVERIEAVAARLVDGLAEYDAEQSEEIQDADETGDADAIVGAPAPRDIMLCPKMRVSNPPAADANGLVRKSGAMGLYRDIEILLMPATNACISSGYGDRDGKLHKGVDYYTKTGGDVLAAAEGVIVEAASRSDYGNMIVIDHGMGVYTRYAHLERFDNGVRVGADVARGQVLGPIGMTGASSILHLHWELLSGDIHSRAGSFGLQSIDPFSLPPA